MWRAQPHPPVTKGQDAQRPAGRVLPPCHWVVPGWDNTLWAKGTRKTLRSADGRDAQCGQGPHVGQASALDRKRIPLLPGKPCVQIHPPRTLLPTIQVRRAVIRVPTLPERRGGLNRVALPGQQAKLPGAGSDPSGVKAVWTRPLPGQHEQESHLPSEPTPQVCP